MQSGDQRQRSLGSKLEHQLLQIQINCQHMLSYAKSLNSLGDQLEDDRVACRKFEAIRNEIRQRMKEFAGNIDEMFRLQDRKICLLLRQLNKDQLNCTGRFTLRQVEDAHQAEQTIKALQAKLQDMHKREIQSKKEMGELKLKHAKLIDQINSCSLSSKLQIKQLKDELEIYRTAKTRKEEILPALLSKRPANKPAFNISDQSTSNEYGLESSRTEQSYAVEPKLKLRCPEESQKKDELDKTRRLQFLLTSLRESRVSNSGISLTESNSFRESSSLASAEQKEGVRRYMI